MRGERPVTGLTSGDDLRPNDQECIGYRRGAAQRQPREQVLCYRPEYAKRIFSKQIYDSNGTVAFVSIEVSPTLAHCLREHHRRGERPAFARKAAQRVHQNPRHEEEASAIEEAIFTSDCGEPTTLLFSTIGYPGCGGVPPRRRTCPYRNLTIWGPAGSDLNFKQPLDGR